MVFYFQINPFELNESKRLENMNEYGEAFYAATEHLTPTVVALNRFLNEKSFGSYTSMIK